MSSKKVKKGTKKVNRAEIRETLLELTDGLLTSIGEVILAELLFGLNLLVAGSYSGSVYRASKAADEMLESIRSETIKSTCYQLKYKGHVTYVKGRNAAPSAKLTKAGLERIESILPQYRERRPWDGRLYLVTYDVPEEQRQKRDDLRYFLKKIGCGLLQRSVWITPYNPKEALEKIVRDCNIVGDIIVSDTGKEGSVGKTNFKELMERVYNLKETNDRYKEFIEVCQRKGYKTRERLIFRFLSIVADDPQLPYELLPNDWLGDKAHLLFKKL